MDNVPQQDSAERAFNKLARTFAVQLAALKRYRSGGEQKVTVHHVTVNEGGHVIVGAVSPAAAGSTVHAEVGRVTRATGPTSTGCTQPALRQNGEQYRLCYDGHGGIATIGDHWTGPHGSNQATPRVPQSHRTLLTYI